jgi:hypothetical protein
MQTVTQDISSKKHVNAKPASISKSTHKDVVKAAELSPAKDNSLERLIASCCDCV